MNRFVFNAFGGIVAVSLLFVFCAPAISPFENPDSSAITLVFKDSHGRVTKSEEGYTDTAGNMFQIGVCPVFYNYIDSVWIRISRNDNNASLADADSFRAFKSFGAETDTQWYIVTFKTPGERTIKATYFVNNGKNRFVLGSFIIGGRKVAIETQPASAVIDEGKPVSFTVGAAGAAPLSYQWKHEGEVITSNGTSATYTITKTVLADSGKYTCIVKNAILDSMESVIARLTIIPSIDTGSNKPGANHKPIITPTTTNVQRNGSATITLLATDPDTNALSGWQITKGPLHGTQIPSPALPTILYTPAKEYIGKDTISYTVSDGKLTSDVGFLIITVDSSKVAPLIIKQPRDTMVYSGTAITLKVETNECFPTPTFKWYKFGTTESICSTQTFTKNNVTASDSGIYCVIVENLAGKATSAGAHVTVNTLQLNVVAGTGGTITTPTISPQGVAYGLPTTITAAPIAGYDFVNWTVTAGKAAVADSTSASTKVTLTSVDAALTANFTKKTFKVTVIASAGGTITAPTTSPLTVDYNVATTIAVAPNTGYNFQGWTVTTGTATIETATSATTKITLTSTDATVTASFGLITYTLTPTSNPSDGGTIAASPATGPYNSGSTVLLTATASTGFNFAGWSQDASGSATTATITMDGNKKVTANFTRITYTLTTNVSPSGAGTIAASPANGPYNSGSSVSLAASASNGYRFSSWSGDAGGTTSPVSVMMNGNKSVTCLFEVAAPSLTTQPSNASVFMSETAVFTVVATGVGSISYQWQRNNSDLSGETSATLRWKAVKSENGYTFRCVVTNAGGATTSSAATLTVTSTLNYHGVVYNTMVFGNQIWTVENLKTTTLNDGSSIPSGTTDSNWAALQSPAYCWPNNQPGNKDGYGALYNWFTVNSGKLAPQGWRVPTEADWRNLISYVNSSGITWAPFAMVLAGYRTGDGTGKFESFGETNWFWTTTGNATDPVSVGGCCNINTYSEGRYGFSVRLIRN
jgi:uncharacterized protein (TIGR02145 family)/uncharacterized repeat protein (TIGR02543 family)